MQKSRQQRSQVRVTLLYGMAVLVGIALAGVAMWQVPWQMDKIYLNNDLPLPVATTVTGVRTSLLAIGAGGLAAVGILYTHRTLQHTRERDDEQAELTREGQYTDRYTQAVTQIASDEPVQQLGGIYALERIMRDSEKDHVTIVEVLAAFVREHAPASLPPSTRHRLRRARRNLRAGTPVTPAQRETYTERDLWEPHRPTEPVQAALTVLGRRPEGRDEPFHINLAWTDLRRANLDNARLEGVNLANARLERATLVEARLKGASLIKAHLEWATLVQTRLEGADLTGAHLEHAAMNGVHLEGAHLTGGARLDGAGMYGAHLQGADLTDAYLWAYLFGAHMDGAELNETHLELASPNLTAAQVVSARPRRSTHLPEYLAANDDVRARIIAVEEEENRRVSG
ncbi:pentapeptide repeat-containing protein [Streptomyces sp. NPDC054834]